MKRASASPESASRNMSRTALAGISEICNCSSAIAPPSSVGLQRVDQVAEDELDHPIQCDDDHHVERRHATATLAQEPQRQPWPWPRESLALFTPLIRRRLLSMRSKSLCVAAIRRTAFFAARPFAGLMWRF